jgi:hypothetical protein
MLDRLAGFDPADYSHRPGQSTPFDLFLEEVVEEFGSQRATA